MRMCEPNLPFKRKLRWLYPGTLGICFQDPIDYIVVGFLLQLRHNEELLRCY